MAMQPEEDVLRHLLGGGAIAQEVEREAEHHPLVPPHEVLEPEALGLFVPGRLWRRVGRFRQHVSLTSF